MTFETELVEGNFQDWERAKADVESLCDQENDFGILEVFQYSQETIAEWNRVQGFWESENTGEKLMLMVTELGEAMEGHRKPGPSDHIPTFSKIEEELADTMIRIFDFAGHHGLRLGDAFVEKLRYNLTRPRMHGKTC